MPSSSKVTSILPALALFFTATLAGAQPASDGETIFTQKCAACHTIGGGKLVGPDLKGVTSRRDKAWLQRQIKEPDQLIAEGDPIALQLVKEMNGVQMAPLGLSDAEVSSVIDFLGASEKGQQVAAGMPTQFLPTLLIGAVLALGITGLALSSGKKTVDPR